MTNGAFVKLWNDICGHYGYREASNVRIINVYCNAAKDVEDCDSGNLLSDILRECERFPSLSRFEDICKSNMPKNPVPKYFNAEKCWYCLDRGYMISEKNCAYGCPKCNMGKKFLRQNYPPYNLKFGDEALEALAKENKEHIVPPIEVSKAKFLAAVASWKVQKM